MVWSVLPVSKPLPKEPLLREGEQPLHSPRRKEQPWVAAAASKTCSGRSYSDGYFYTAVSQERKTLLCQLLRCVDIKTQTSKQNPQTNSANLCYFSHTKGKSLWNSVFLIPVLMFQLPETKQSWNIFWIKAWEALQVEKLRDTAFIVTLLMASPRPALPSPRGPMALNVLLSACMESHVVQENRGNTDGVSDWQILGVTDHRQEGDDITWVYCSRSMAASAYFVCSTSFPTRKSWVSAFPKHLDFCARKLQSRGKIPLTETRSICSHMYSIAKLQL